MPGGRPTDYKPEFVQRCAELCAHGATDAELADEFDVSVRTLYSWRNRYPEFLQALKTNKELADERVERSLYERATGYERDSVKIFCQEGQIIQATFREHVPPDSTAMIFWLKNRKPEVWRDRVQQEHSGPDGGAIQIVSTIPRPPKDVE
jgi:transposase-like protein